MLSIVHCGRSIRQSTLSIVMLSVLAGVFTGLGGLAFTQVTVGADTAFGPTRFLGGVLVGLAYGLAYRSNR